MGGGKRWRSRARDAVDGDGDHDDGNADAHNVVYYDRDHVEASDGPSRGGDGADPTATGGATGGATNRGVARSVAGSGSGGSSQRRGGGGGGKDALVWWNISQSQASQMSQYSAAENPHDAPSGSGGTSKYMGQNQQLPSSAARFLPRYERRRRSQLAQEHQRNVHSDSSSEGSGDGVDKEEGDGKVEEGSEDPFATIVGSQRNDDLDGGDEEEDDDEEMDERHGSSNRSDDTGNSSRVQGNFLVDQKMGQQCNAGANNFDDDFDFPNPSPPTSPIPDDGHNPTYSSRGGNPSQRTTASIYTGGLHYDDDHQGYAYGDDGGCGGIDMNDLRRQSMKRQSMPMSMTASRSVSSKKRSRSSFAETGGRGLSIHDDDDLMSDLTNAAGGNTDMLVAARKAAAFKTGSSGRSSISSANQSRSNGTSSRQSDNGVKKAKSSIVGSRPMHWGGGLGRNRSSSATKKRQNESSASAKVTKKKLSDATRRSTMDQLSSSSRRKSRVKEVAPKTPATGLGRAAASASGGGGATAAHTPKSKGSKSADTPGTASSSKRERHVNLREMEFAPAFISSRPSDTDASAAMGLSIEDDVTLTPNGHQVHPQGSQGVTPVRFNLDGSSGGVDPAMASSISATPCLSGKRSRKRDKAMGLTKLLRDIRSASDGDCMRLKSGASQAHRDLTKRRRTDVSDPRNRAAYSIDVTLLGDPIPWEGGIKRTTILGYVHSTHIQKADDVIAHMLPKAEAFAWMILDYDTINEKRVNRGTQLRIYDPMVFPSRYTSLSAIGCTKVCELYPADLAPLSGVPKCDGAIVEG